jgi:hypothetical protein
MTDPKDKIVNTQIKMLGSRLNAIIPIKKRGTTI